MPRWAGWSLSLLIAIVGGVIRYATDSHEAPGLSAEQMQEARAIAKALETAEPDAILELWQRLEALDDDHHAAETWRALLEASQSLPRLKQILVCEEVSFVSEVAVRERAMFRLGELGAMRFLAEKALREPTDELRALAARLLAESPDGLDDVVAEYLCEAAFDRMSEVRVQACRALGNAGPSTLVDDVLRGRGEEASEAVHVAALGALIRRVHLGAMDRTTLEAWNLAPKDRQAREALVREPHVRQILEDGTWPDSWAPRRANERDR